MKKYIYILFISLVFHSCSDEPLDLSPQTVVLAEDFYITEQDFQQANIGLYVPLRSLYGSGMADNGAWIMGEMRSDNTTFSYNASNRGYIDKEYYDLLVDDSNGTAIANKYNNDYIIIERANQILSRIDHAEINQTLKDWYKGQALFLRAFAYFDLVQYFGDVPLVTVSATSYEEAYLARTPKSEVYDQIIIDAQNAASLLSPPSVNTRGYVAKGAAYTLLGNVYIVLKQWEKAEEALLNVKGYNLLFNYAAIFDPDNKNNAESIFEVQYNDDPSAEVASSFAYNFLPILYNLGVISGFPLGASNNYGGWNTPTPDLIQSYENGDKRLQASIGFYTGGGYVNRPYIKKYCHGSYVAPNTNDDFPVYRYAEVLLFLAEAINEQGGRSTEALYYLNQVHAHDRTGLEALQITDQDQLRDAIFKERQIELAFENKRWLDLVRSGKAIEVLNTQGVKIKANPEAYYYPGAVEPVSASYHLTENRLIFPIPQREIRLNPNMVQNPGY